MPEIILGLITTRTEEMIIAVRIIAEGISMPAKTLKSAVLDLANPSSNVSE